MCTRWCNFFGRVRVLGRCPVKLPTLAKLPTESECCMARFWVGGKNRYQSACFCLKSINWRVHARTYQIFGGNLALVRCPIKCSTLAMFPTEVEFRMARLGINRKSVLLKKHEFTSACWCQFFSRARAMGCCPVKFNAYSKFPIELKFRREMFWIDMKIVWQRACFFRKSLVGTRPRWRQFLVECEFWSVVLPNFPLCLSY